MVMVRIAKEWVDVYFEYGIDIANRRIFLLDGVEEDTISAVIKGLYFMDSQNKDVKKPIELFIGSFGGSEYEMFALYDVTRTIASPIHTVAIGKCMSAAPLLVAGGQKGHRYATANTFFMVHEGWSDFGEKRYDSIKADIKHVDHLSKHWYELMEKHTSKTIAFWKKMCAKVGDEYFDAATALEYGIIDHIWDEKEGDPA
jgi:ATP-dependent Clp protease protease subunit